MAVAWRAPSGKLPGEILVEPECFTRGRDGRSTDADLPIESIAQAIDD